MMGRIMGFRMMHLQGRLLTSLLHHLETDLLHTPLQAYFYSEGEVISGMYLGWNFGDGHLHNEDLLYLFQMEHSFKKHDLVCICVEPQGWFSSSLSYRVIDAQEGLLLEGSFKVKTLKQGQPWDLIQDFDQ
jgi:hypothetical protein